MRFVLDNDVDAGCRGVLQAAGHEAWTVQEAGRGDGADADHAVYAHNKGACFVSHDKDFARWRTDMPIGQHLRLGCRQIEAADVLEAKLPEVEALLRVPNIVIVVKINGIEAHY